MRHDAHRRFCCLPLVVFRSPHWDEDTTHEMLDRAERESFMKWRRELATSVAARTAKRERCEAALRSRVSGEPTALLCSLFVCYLLCSMEESNVDDRQLTPFEKNLEVWKQLWRVLERSHIIVQILDARNPLLFRSTDLEKYAGEIVSTDGSKKTCLLVINKADYLTPTARRMWAEYFDAKGIDFVFFSAALEQARLDDLDRAKRRREQRHNYHGHNIDRVDDGRIKGASSDEDDDDARAHHVEDDDVVYEEDEEEEEKEGGLKASSLWKAAEHTEKHPAIEALSIAASAAATPAVAAAESSAAAAAPAAAASSSSASSSSAAAVPAEHAAASSSSSAAASSASASPSAAAPVVHQILTRDALFSYITSKYCASSPENAERYASGEKIVVGMCGYPNVGKSSTINVLAAAKKVTVGATPGKTKHFQTINVNDQITLCDW